MIASRSEPGTIATRRWGDLGLRLASALVMIAVAVSTALTGGIFFDLLWLAAALAVVWEWQTMIGGAARLPRLIVGMLALVAVAVLVTWTHLTAAFGLLGVAVLVLAFLAEPGRRLWAAAGLLYAGVLLVAALALRASPVDGARSILWLFATVWATDTFAYFGGRLIGGPKLAPRISPSKTWSGTLTGVIVGTSIGVFVACQGAGAPGSIPALIALTLTASVLSQAGDAVESAVKRRFGVKDSSGLIPGHGGVMDRIDGFVAAAALAFFVGLARDPDAIARGLFHPV